MAKKKKKGEKQWPLSLTIQVLWFWWNRATNEKYYVMLVTIMVANLFKITGSTA